MACCIGAALESATLADDVFTHVLSVMMSPDPTPVVLITGAAKRLGREIALHAARAGWRVAVHYRGSSADAQATVADCASLTEGSHAFQADLADEAATRDLLPAVVAHMGQVDAVVNCAALFEHDTPVTFSYAALETHLRANTAAPIVLAQALYTHVLARNAASAPLASPAPAPARASLAAAPKVPVVQGVVVNLLDQKLWNPNPDFLSYTLSKAALESANTLLAMALAPLVRVVGVAPGLTLTSHMLSDEKFKALHAISPLGRSSTPQDVCATVLFALTNQSITGTTLLVDGGQHLMKFERDFSLM
jgi:NAD(P)-dependent dehydrogenase (short-subunit alcohol dehydrogenase family)